jgi:sarcosine oxidase subunit delta
MLRIPCPHCGVRDEIEFRYRGDASAARPSEAACSESEPGLAAFSAYVYERANTHGWHLEWWLHVAGCRKLLKVARHTLTHQIAWVGGPKDTPDFPQEPAV